MIAMLLLLTAPATVQTFQVAGIERQAIVVRSNTTSAAPLVFVYHGHGGGMRQAQRSFDIEKLWPEANIVYPNGLPTKGMTDPEGRLNGWQQRRGDDGDRDLAFFDVMLKSLKASLNVDPARVYVMGHSNGGRMTYLLWAERGDAFAAVAPSASPGIGVLRDLKPIPAFIVAGEQDQIVPFRSQKFSIDAVRSLLRADPSRAKKDGYTTLEPAAAGMELGTYIFPGPHMIPQPAIAQIVEFFKRHPKT